MGMHHMQLQLVNVYRDEDEMSRTLPYQSLTKEYLPLMQHIRSIWHTCSESHMYSDNKYRCHTLMAVMNSACCVSMYVHFGNSLVDEYLCIHAHTHTHQVCL